MTWNRHRDEAAAQVAGLLREQVEACRKFSGRGTPTPLIIGAQSARAIEHLSRALAALTSEPIEEVAKAFREWEKHWEEARR